MHDVAKFFAPEFWRGHGDLPAAYTARVEKELARLRSRGIEDPGRLAEAYLTEQRGAQYINAQLRSARCEVPVSNPFAHRRMLGPASRLPFDLKIHNRLNQRMLSRAAPSMLEEPLAAVLTPASAPLGIQEASRVLRKAWEEGRWSMHELTGGRTGIPSLSWIDFSLLCDTECLRNVAADFQWSGWDREAIRSLAESVDAGSWRGSLHKPLFQLLKLYTLDLQLRAS